MRKFLLVALLTLAPATAYAQFADATVAPDVVVVADVPVAAPTDLGLHTTDTGLGLVVVTVTNTPVAPDADLSAAIESVPVLIQAFKNGNWRLGLATLMSLIVWVFLFVIRKFWPKAFVDGKLKKWVPLFSVLLSELVAIPTLLTMTNMAWWQVLIAGLTVGLMAIGGWELLLKLVLPKPTDPNPTPPVPVTPPTP